LDRQIQERRIMTDAFNRTAFIGAEELELRPEARVMVFADRVTRDAAVDVFRDCVCVSVMGALDQISWIGLIDRSLVVRGDEDFCDRVADHAEDFADGMLVLGLEPFDGADAESILAKAAPPKPFDDRLIRRTATDPGAPFEAHILDRFVDMKPDSYARIRARLSREAGFHQLGALDQAVKQIRDARSSGEVDDEPQIDRLLAIASQYECFRNELEKPYVSLAATRPDGGAHIETFGVRARKLRLSLIYQYYRRYRRAPGDTAIRVVLDSLEAKSLCGGIIRPVAIRHCWHDGKIYIDLGTEDRRVIEIDPVDWRILDGPPTEVRFLRPTGTLPLPIPVRVHPTVALGKLKEVTRFQTTRDEILSVGFILHSIAGKKPYVVLLITGEPGAAKTAHVIVIGGLVDPRSVLKGTALTTKRDVYIAASTRGLTVLNNLSELSRELADAICTASEGGVDARRALYTDEDESNIYAASPFVITSIYNVANPYGDLSNRTVRVDLAAMPRAERLSESDFQRKFDEAAPAILGGMLSALSVGLRRLPDLVVKDLPRLAEFATFAIACETAFGWDEGTFLAAFNEAAETNADEVLLGDPVASVLQGFMDDREDISEGQKEWKGTASELLKQLETVVRAPERAADLAHAVTKSAVGNSTVPADVRKLAEAASDLKEAREHVHRIIDIKWPKAPNALSARLKLVGPQLKDAGIWIKWPTGHRDGKVLEITFIYSSPAHIKGRGKRSSSSTTTSFAQELNNLSNNDLAVEDDHDRPPDRSRNSSDPDYLPPEPDHPHQHNPHGGSASSSISDSASSSNRPNTPGLHKGRKGFEI
jgi:hypothetical protein